MLFKSITFIRKIIKELLYNERYFGKLEIEIDAITAKQVNTVEYTEHCLHLIQKWREIYNIHSMHCTLDMYLQYS